MYNQGVGLYPESESPSKGRLCLLTPVQSCSVLFVDCSDLMRERMNRSRVGRGRSPLVELYTVETMVGTGRRRSSDTREGATEPGAAG